MRREKKGVSLKKVLISSAALATTAGALTMTAVAQDDADEEAAVQETIVVTGSRIPTDPNLASSTPVQSIDEAQIRLSGELNLADVVNDIPALVSSFTGANTLTDGFADVDPGANILNLRGLGGERTLTLVNGRRHVAGFRGSQAVDIGTIPRALVENVEVTTGGASAIYGADAVTGVVNFILKDDFEGMQIDARAGISGKWTQKTSPWMCSGDRITTMIAVTSYCLSRSSRIQASRWETAIGLVTMGLIRPKPIQHL